MRMLLALLSGLLMSAGIYLMLRRSLVKLVLGILTLSHGVNLLIFSAGTLIFGGAPLISATATTLAGAHSDPVPQALILTAIVIGFGVQAFFLVLLRQVYRTLGTDDVDQLRGGSR